MLRNTDDDVDDNVRICYVFYINSSSVPEKKSNKESSSVSEKKRLGYMKQQRVGEEAFRIYYEAAA